MSDLAANVKEQIEECAGYWHSCSGCHESVDGHSVTPIDPVFRCAPGGGCRECGGIGVVWDNIDYDDFVKFNIEEDRKDAEITQLRAERDAAAREAERLRAVLTGLAEDFESARDKATYAAEAQRLHKCAQEIRGLAVLRQKERRQMDKHLWEINHSYCCNHSNYYAAGNEQPTEHFRSFSAFLGENRDADKDYNLLFRWDWKEGEDENLPPFNGDVNYRNGQLCLYYMGQRKGLYRWVTIEVCRADEPAVIAFLKPQWDHLQSLWEGISLPSHKGETP